MSFLLLLAFMGLRIGQICESNVVDELHLEEAHYAAQKGVHWFVGYCKSVSYTHLDVYKRQGYNSRYFI